MTNPDNESAQASSKYEIRGEHGPEALVPLDRDRAQIRKEWKQANREHLRRVKWRAFWWGFWHPFSDPRQATRDLTRREERRYARQFIHGQRPWWSCWQTARRLCVRCMWRDLTGANKRAKRAYVEQMRERAKSIPPSAVRRYRQRPDGSWEREGA